MRRNSEPLIDDERQVASRIIDTLVQNRQPTDP